MTDPPTAELMVEKKRGLRFDPTITAGNLLTVFGAMVMVLAAYAALVTRIAVNETSYAMHVKGNEEQVQRQNEAVNSLRGDIKEVQQAVMALTLAVAKGSNKQ